MCKQLVQLLKLKTVMRLTSGKINKASQVLGLILLVSAAGDRSAGAARFSANGQQADEVDAISPKAAERIIAGRVHQVMLALKARNVARLSTFVHPQKGLRFSPYASVLPDEDRVVKRSQLAQMWASPKRYNWGGGGYDGSGDPILLTLKKYYGRFIFDHDFSRAKYVAYNPLSMSHGNTPNTIREHYPKSIAVEYHFSGFDPKFDGMDWTSLWLVFEKRGSEWYLVGIVHDEWTI